MMDIEFYKKGKGGFQDNPESLLCFE